MDNGIETQLSMMSMAGEDEECAVGGGIQSPTCHSRNVSPTEVAEPSEVVVKWTRDDIVGWLTEIGMSSYTHLLVKEHCVTSGTALLQLTEEHLKEMGIGVVGHRLEMVGALERLRLESGLLPHAQFVQMSKFAKEVESHHLQAILSNFPKRIILIRHAESQGNVEKDLYAHIPDAKLTITSTGMRQAELAGESLRQLIGTESVSFYVSPFIRSKQTLEGIRKSFDEDQVLFAREDPRIREQEWGNFQSPKDMPRVMEERRRIGAFFYRFPTGESGADVYDRASIFLESLYRDMRKGKCGQNAVIVSHGLFCRLFLTRFYRWSVEHFHRIWNFKNCQYAIMEYQAQEGYYKLLTKLKMDPV